MLYLPSSTVILNIAYNVFWLCTEEVPQKMLRALALADVDILVAHLNTSINNHICFIGTTLGELKLHISCAPFSRVRDKGKGQRINHMTLIATCCGLVYLGQYFAYRT